MSRTPDADAVEMRRLYETMPHIWSLGGLADYYGVDRKTVWNIVNYKTHKHAALAAEIQEEA